MAPSIRSALGAVKDQTSIGLARVSSNLAPELGVLIVKVTSHDDEPAEERHVREILTLTSYSGAYVCSCVATVARRISRTRDWIVAVKALCLVHRLLNDGDPGFRRELLNFTRRGGRVLLNLSSFRDEAHSSSWDLSAFVRSFAGYLDRRLDSDLGTNGNSSRDRPGDGEFEIYGDRSSRSGGGGDRTAKSVTPAREMSTERALGRMKQLQQLLDRFLGCRPTGRAKTSRLVLVALYTLVRESFQIYADVCEMLALLLDRFFDMEYSDCVKAFDAYVTAGKQIDELVAFYGWCKDTGLARSSEYPEIQRITDKLLQTLEEFLREKERSPPAAAAAAAVEVEEVKNEPVAAVPDEVAKEEEEIFPEEDELESVKALPAPEEKKAEEEARDLVDLRDDKVDQGDRFALALFTAAADWNGNAETNSNSTNSRSAWENPAAEPGKADWEIVLVETATNLSNQKPHLAGGLDSVLLDGLYDQGAVTQHVATSSLSTLGGSSSSVALPLPGRSTPVLALPAPDGTVTAVGQDPFSASLSVPPPSYVQMAEIERKQQLLVQEQHAWNLYASDGMRGQLSLAKLSMGYAVPPGISYGYGMPPPVHGAGYY